MRGPHGDAHLSLALASLVIGLTLCSLLLLAALGPAAQNALASPLDTPTVASATTTPQPTQATAATLVLLSPATGQGPVGANLTFAGARWSGSQVTLTAATTSCASPAGTLGQTSVGQNGSFTVTLNWPSSLAASGTAYLLCATSDGGGSATSAQMYRVRATSAPALALSVDQVAAGQEVHLQGNNFVGATAVALAIQTPRGTRALPTVTPDPKDGSFVASYTPLSADVGTVTLMATSAPDSSAPPALQASATVTVGPPLPPTATAVVTPATANGPIIVTSGDNSDAFAPSVLLAVGALLALLVLCGLVAWLLMRPRSARHSRPGPMPGAAPSPTPGQLASGRHTARHSARPSPMPAAQRTTARVPVGAGVRATGRVAAFPDADPPEASAPPREWQRRPMSAKLWSYADKSYADKSYADKSYADKSYDDPYDYRYGARGTDAPGVKGGYDPDYDDDTPTTPAGHGYFGLPSLESPDTGVTQPQGPALPEAHE